MVRFNIKNVLQLAGVFIFLASISVSSSVNANCNYYQDDIPKLQDNILSLSTSSIFLDQLMRGKVVHDITLASLFKIPLDNDSKVMPAIKLLQKQMSNLEDPLTMSDELAACAEQGQRWLELSNQRRQAETSLIKQKILS